MNSGTNDYPVKLFDLDELVTRIHALARRYAGFASVEIEYGSLRLNPITNKVLQMGQVMDLPAREFALHYALLEIARYFIVACIQLEEHLYG